MNIVLFISNCLHFLSSFSYKNVLQISWIIIDICLSTVVGNMEQRTTIKRRETCLSNSWKFQQSNWKKEDLLSKNLNNSISVSFISNWLYFVSLVSYKNFLKISWTFIDKYLSIVGGNIEQTIANKTTKTCLSNS